MKGITPRMIWRKPMSGAMPLMTKRLSPTGGVMRPISMLMVRTMPNQIGSKPAARMPGMITGVTIRMIATGGRKQPSTSSRMFTQNR
jgi:hypothetical protein